MNLASVKLSKNQQGQRNTCHCDKLRDAATFKGKSSKSQVILYFLQHGCLDPPVASSNLKMKVVFVHSFVDPVWSFFYICTSVMSVCVQWKLYLLVFSHWVACFVLVVFSIHLPSQQLFFMVLVVQINVQLLFSSNVYVITATGKEEYETVEGRCCYFSLTAPWLFDE